jgi:hypothetical protein
MSISISAANIKLFAVLSGLLGSISVAANIHPVLTLIFAVLYLFVIPAHWIQGYLQTTFVGLDLRGKTIFLFPIIVPLMIVLAIPFWALNNEFSQTIFQWTTIVLVTSILAETVLVVSFARLVIIPIDFTNLRNLFLGLLGLALGLLLAWLL